MSERVRRLAALAALVFLIPLPSCSGRAKPVPPVTAWTRYRAEGGGYSMEVPKGWKITERGGVGGFETTVRANHNNWIVVSKQLLPGGLEAKLIRSDTRDQAIIGAVQAHYESLGRRFADFLGTAPQVSAVAGSMAGIGSFTCTAKAGIGPRTVQLVGSTVLIFGLNNLYVLDAYADPDSSDAVLAAFEHVVSTFKYED